MIKDYYSVLGISSRASITEVKKAYRKLVLQYHPDQNKSESAEQTFIEITEAYEVLADPNKRAEYDQLYHWFYETASPKGKEVQTETATKQNEWTEYGHKKAKEYSSISVDELSRRILKELSVGASYLPNVIAIGIVILVAIIILSNIPDLGEEFPGLVLIILAMVIGLGFLAFHLFKVAKEDYKEDRKRIF